MNIQRQVVTIVTDGSQNATEYSTNLTGKLVSIRYVKGDYANGVVFAITAEATGEGIWAETAVNSSKTVHPRAPTHDIVGAPGLYAAAGQAVTDKIALFNDRIKFAITLGGAAKTGTFHITTE